MDLPRFTKDDVVGWLSRCDSYFDLDKTPEEYRVTMASLVLDKVGYQWYDGFKKSAQNPITWQTFSEGIRARFSANLQRPLEELVQLKQTGSLSDYQEKFEKISCQSNLTEDQKLDCYLGGLKEELAWDVRLFNPRTVLDATRLAKIKEMSIWSVTKTGFEPGKGVTAGVKGQTVPQDQRGILGNPGYRFQSKMTPAELDEHRSKSLCFFCHEKFTPGHNCQQRQRTQVFFMELEDNTLVQTTEVEVTQKDEPEAEEQLPTATLNSLVGNVYSGGNTMRVKGTVGNKTLHILLDTWSSHNFLCSKFGKNLASGTAEMKPLLITVADGGKVQGNKMIRNFSWGMQGHEFTTDVIMFPLVGCGLILGMLWLRTLGAIAWDCANLTMEFVKRGERVKIVACQGIKNQLPLEDNDQPQLKSSQTYYI